MILGVTGGLVLPAEPAAAAEESRTARKQRPLLPAMRAPIAHGEPTAGQSRAFLRVSATRLTTSERACEALSCQKVGAMSSSIASTSWSNLTKEGIQAPQKEIWDFRVYFLFSA